MADSNRVGLPPSEYLRCWPYHLAMKPFYHCASQVWSERATYYFCGIYDAWLRRKLRMITCPKFDVAHAIMGFATALFDRADEVGALKVLDCPNSHPTTYYGFWQRECDLWCPGETVSIPRIAFARMNRELHRADMIIVQSTFCQESMVLNGIPAEKVFVNPMGVNTATFHKRTSVALKPRFVCVATICVRKGHQYLFRAFDLVKQKIPNAELICVGDYKSDFRKERPKWEGKFTHFPRLTHAEIAQLLPTCCAFVFPSQEEGIGRAQIEAMACGLPVIGTHEGGTSTVIADGAGGFIVNSRDPRQMADAMVRLATDLELNWRLGETAFQRAGAQNTWQDYGDRLLREYERRIRK
jgi:glycosyltransferase involved in cell wall biosynthesis